MYIVIVPSERVFVNFLIYLYDNKNFIIIISSYNVQRMFDKVVCVVREDDKRELQF